MTSPSDRARLLLQRYKEANALGTEQKARLGEVVRERVQRGDLPRFDVVPVVAYAASQTSVAQKLWGSVWAKWGLGVVAVGAAAGAGYRTFQVDAAPPEQGAHVATSAHREQLLRASVAAAPPVVPASPSATHAGDSAAVRSPAAVPRAEKSSAAAAAPSAEPTIDEEVKLVTGAQSALRAGDSKRALELLAAHAVRFPNGKLSTLRQVTHMMALCQAGRRTQARQEAAAFVASKPSSPFVERVNGICAGPGTD